MIKVCLAMSLMSSSKGLIYINFRTFVFYFRDQLVFITSFHIPGNHIVQVQSHHSYRRFRIKNGSLIISAYFKAVHFRALLMLSSI